MAKAHMGAVVRYCGHDGAAFVADVWKIENVNVVRASGDLKKFLIRDPALWKKATHHLSDFPAPGFWRPDLGVFVVPLDQVKELK